MSTTRFSILIGLLLGLIWAVSGNFAFVVWSIVFGLIGWGVGMVLEGRISVDMSNAFTSGDGRQGGLGGGNAATSSSATRRSSTLR